MLIIQKLSAETDLLINASKANFPFVLKIIACLWGIQFLNALLKGRLMIFGILPRHLWGLIGIPLSPFLHNSFGHLAMNTVPLTLLMLLVLMYGKLQFYYVSVTIIGISGLLTWLIGRDGFHIGASGVVMGYWGYTLMNAYEHFSLNSVILAALCLYYFAGLYINLFPTEKQASWEAHVSGLIAGIAASFLLPVPAL